MSQCLVLHRLRHDPYHSLTTAKQTSTTPHPSPLLRAGRRSGASWTLLKVGTYFVDNVGCASSWHLGCIPCAPTLFSEPTSLLCQEYDLSLPFLSFSDYLLCRSCEKNCLEIQVFKCGGLSLDAKIRTKLNKYVDEEEVTLT